LFNFFVMMLDKNGISSVELSYGDDGNDDGIIKLKQVFHNCVIHALKGSWW